MLNYTFQDAWLLTCELEFKMKPTVSPILFTTKIKVMTVMILWHGPNTFQSGRNSFQTQSLQFKSGMIPFQTGIESFQTKPSFHGKFTVSQQ